MLPIVVACSGAKPSGHLADLIARRLQDEGAARMVSIAGLNSSMREMSDAACSSRVIVIDGCNDDCAKLAMDAIGFDQCHYVNLQEIGLTEPDGASVKRGVRHVRELLAAEEEGPDATAAGRS